MAAALFRGLLQEEDMALEKACEASFTSAFSQTDHIKAPRIMLDRLHGVA